MPFASVSELPERVRNNIPSQEGKRLFLSVVNSALERGRTDSVAFASAWAALSDAGFEQNADGKWTKMRKRELEDDVFTTEAEAAARSVDLGFDGATHVHETANGMRVFMPGPSHEAYLEQARREASDQENGPNLLQQAISAILGVVLDRDRDHNMQGVIVKRDEEQRIVYGWASVVTEKGQPVVDKQDDIISPDEMESMATDFMLSARTAKAMHEGEGIGEVVHSLPLTKTLAESLGIETQREGWIIAMKIHDDAVWQRVKTGELKAFSIGGRAAHA